MLASQQHTPDAHLLGVVAQCAHLQLGDPLAQEQEPASQPAEDEFQTQRGRSSRRSAAAQNVRSAVKHEQNGYDEDTADEGQEDEVCSPDRQMQHVSLLAHSMNASAVQRRTNTITVVYDSLSSVGKRHSTWM